MSFTKPGEAFDTWKIVEPLGEGGNGEVWRVEETNTSEVGALKLLRNRDPSKVPYKRFRREVQLVMSLNGMPGIVPIIDANVPENPAKREKVWYVMPVAQELADIVEHLSARETVEAVRDISATLEHLHTDFEISHRDIKPDNLLWLDGRPAVSDFGLAAVPNDDPLTEPDRIPGAFGFMANEVIMGEQDVDWHKSDVFSLSKVLWVLLVPGRGFPPQGQLSDDGGQLSLIRRLSIPGKRAGDLDRILAEGTAEVNSRISMGDLTNELNAWLNDDAEGGSQVNSDTMNAAIEAARRSVEPTVAGRDLEATRKTRCAETLASIEGYAGPIIDVFTNIDSGATIGYAAVGKFSKLTEALEHMGSTPIVSTHHFGARLERDRNGLNWILIFDICLQVDQAGIGSVKGLLMTAYEDVLGGGSTCHADDSSAVVGGIDLDAKIKRMINELLDELPSMIDDFSAD